MGDPTVNYGFIEADESDLMSDFETYINGNYNKIEGVPAPDIITGALPQSGSYNLYDRVFRTNDNSIYILVVKSGVWGWHWRPVQAAISPWVNITGGNIFATGFWSSTTLSVAYDNRGCIHWRGVLNRAAPMVAFVTESIFSQMPLNMYPTRSVHLACDPDNPNVTATGLTMVQYVRIYVGGKDRSSGDFSGTSDLVLIGGNTSGTQPSNVYFNTSWSVGAEPFVDF